MVDGRWRAGVATFPGRSRCWPEFNLINNMCFTARARTERADPDCKAEVRLTPLELQR